MEYVRVMGGQAGVFLASGVPTQGQWPGCQVEKVQRPDLHPGRGNGNWLAGTASLAVAGRGVGRLERGLAGRVGKWAFSTAGLASCLVLSKCREMDRGTVAKCSQGLSTLVVRQSFVIA